MLLSADTLARFLGLMLIAWQPFWSGARLPTLLLVLVGLWMLWHKQIDFSSTPAKRLGIVFLLLGIPVLISIPGSYDVQGSISVAVVLLLFYIVGLALLQALKRDEDHQWLQKWLLIVLLAWVADGYIQYFFGRDLLGVPLWDGGRVIGPFRDNLHLGLFLAVLLPTALWELASIRPTTAMFIFAWASPIVVLSGARSNLLLLLLAAIILLMQFQKWHRLALLSALSIVLALSIAASPDLTNRFKRIFAVHENSALTTSEKLDSITTMRATIWTNAWQMIKDRPLVGVGANAFAEAYPFYAPAYDYFITKEPVYHAHQMYVSIAAESGIIGLASFITLIILCVTWYREASPTSRRKAAPYAASLAIVAFPLQSQPVLYTIWWFPILLLLTCAMLAAIDSERIINSHP